MKTELSGKRADIVNASRKLFQMNGYEKTTMEEIAREVPMSKATLYREFSNKEEIVLTICENHCNNLITELQLIAEEREKSNLQTLKKLLFVFASSVYEESNSVRTPEVLMYVHNKIKTRFADKFSEIKQVIQSVLDRAIENGELNPGDTKCKDLCEVIVTMLTAYFPPYERNFSKPMPERPGKKVFERELNILLDLLIHGLKSYGDR